MKKTILAIFMILICAAVFAEGTVSLAVTPFSFQDYKSSEKGVEPITSAYGFGIAADCRMTDKNGLTFGLKASTEKYYFGDKKPFLDIAVVGEMGFQKLFNETTGIILLGEFGADVQVFDSLGGIIYVGGGQVGVTYKFAEKFQTAFIVEFLYSMGIADEVKYSNFRVNPYIGIEYKF